jgi:hypothetical protein
MACNTEISSHLSSCTQNLELDPRFLENLCISALKNHPDAQFDISNSSVCYIGRSTNAHKSLTNPCNSIAHNFPKEFLDNWATVSFSHTTTVHEVMSLSYLTSFRYNQGFAFHIYTSSKRSMYSGKLSYHAVECCITTYQTENNDCRISYYLRCWRHI